MAAFGQNSNSSARRNEREAETSKSPTSNSQEAGATLAKAVSLCPAEADSSSAPTPPMNAKPCSKVPRLSACPKCSFLPALAKKPPTSTSTAPPTGQRPRPRLGLHHRRLPGHQKVALLP